jgi:hypothetical protein
VDLPRWRRDGQPAMPPELGVSRRLHPLRCLGPSKSKAVPCICLAGVRLCVRLWCAAADRRCAAADPAYGSLASIATMVYKGGSKEAAAPAEDMER